MLIVLDRIGELADIKYATGQQDLVGRDSIQYSLSQYIYRSLKQTGYKPRICDTRLRC